jgi:hypothetical protein
VIVYSFFFFVVVVVVVVVVAVLLGWSSIAVSFWLEQHLITLSPFPLM